MPRQLPFWINWHVILEEGCGESRESVKSLLGLRHYVQVEDVVYADFPLFTVRMLKGMITSKQNLKPKKPNIGHKIIPGTQPLTQQLKGNPPLLLKLCSGINMNGRSNEFDFKTKRYVAVYLQNAIIKK